MTDKEIERKLEKSPSLKKFAESEDNEKCSRLLSMAYLMFSIANEYTEEANDILKKHNLLHFNIKLWSSRLSQTFDKYHNQMKSMMRGEAKELFCEDYEAFERVCRRFMMTGGNSDDRGEIEKNEDGDVKAQS